MLNVSKFRLVNVCSIVDTEVVDVQIKSLSWTHFFWLIPQHFWDYNGTAVCFVKLCSYTFSQRTLKYHQYPCVHKQSDSSPGWIYSGHLGSSMGQSPTRFDAHTYDRKNTSAYGMSDDETSGAASEFQQNQQTVKCKELLQLMSH